MPTFTIELPDGRKMKAEAPDEAAALSGAKEWYSTNSATPAAPAREPVGTIPAALEGAGQGFSFGSSDELEGAVRMLATKMFGEKQTWGEAWEKGVAIPRERQAAAADTNPVAYYGGEIGSAFAMPGGLARLGYKSAVSAAARQGMAPLMKATAKEGAALGGLYGAGHAEGGLGERAAGAAEGALWGGGIGAALPPVTGVAAALAKRAAAPIRAAMDPQRVGREKVAEALARDIGSADSAAGINSGIDRVQRRIDAAGPGSNMMLGDFGGESTRNLMRAAANMPSNQAQKLKTTLDTRQSHQWQRIERELASTLGPTRSFYAALDAQVARMKEAGTNIIAPALKIETPMTDTLRSVLARPTAKELHTLAARRLADEGREIGLVNRTEMLHRMKMELDDRIGMAKRAEKMGNTPQAGWDARTLLTLKHDLLNSIDNPTYKQGLRHYASEAQLKNAAEDGLENFLKMPVERIEQALSKLGTDAERSMWRAGAARALVDKVRRGNVMRDRTENLFSSPDIQLRIQAVYPENAARREFQKRLVLEAKMSDTRKAVQGNSTTAKQLMQGQEAGQTLDTARNVMGAAAGGIAPLLSLLSRQAQRFSGITPKSADAILKTSMQPDIGDLRPAIADAMRRADLQPEARARLIRTLVSGAAAGVGDQQEPVLKGGTRQGIEAARRLGWDQ